MSVDCIARPAGLAGGRDYGQRAWICANFHWTHEEFAGRSQYISRNLFPNIRTQLFQAGEKVSFKNDSKQITLLESIKADQTVLSWLDVKTTDAINKLKGTDTAEEIFYWVVLKMAVYKIVSDERLLKPAHNTAITHAVVLNNDDDGDGDEVMNEVSRLATHVTVPEASPSPSLPPRGRRSIDPVKQQDLDSRAYQRPTRSITARRLPSRYQDSAAAVGAENGDSNMDMIPDKDLATWQYAEQSRIRHEPPELLRFPKAHPEGPSNPATDVATTPQHDIELQKPLTLVDTNWRWKVILVHLPNNKTYPFVVRAQAAVHGKNPVFSHEITHKMFMDRVQRQSEGTSGLSFSQIIFEDVVYGKRHNLATKEDFYEALTMHEYDGAFGTDPTMEVFVEEK